MSKALHDDAVMNTVLVTGAEGFIGQVLVKMLTERGLTVRTLGRRKSELAVDLAKDSCPPELCAGVDTVFHLAAKAHAVAENRAEIGQYQAINTDGTRKLLEAAQQAGVKRFVLFSSVKAVGDADNQPMDETVDIPADTPYGLSKYQAEQLALHGGYVPHPVAIRPSMVYGNSGKGNLPRMIAAVRRGLFPPLPDLHNRRSMVHVEDVARAAILAAQRPEAIGQVYIVTDGQAYSTRQLYDWIREALGKPAVGWAIPWAILDRLAKIGDVIGGIIGRRLPLDSAALGKLTGSAWYSSAKIERELGFRPQHNLRQSLPDIVRYLKSN